MQPLGAFDKNPSASEDNVLPQSSPYGDLKTHFTNKK